MFTKVLIANRGEIACRVIATCRRLGIRTIAVYSEADAGARHVRLADEAFCIGPPAASESYLCAGKIIEIAKRNNAQAVHPGYGFLSENEGFAAACAQAGIVFIGPPITAIRAMGLKSSAKALMVSANVPVVPGYHGDNQDPDLLHAQADRIGYPVLIKASAGGGGKGMRVVAQSDQFAAALASCQREAQSSFGDDKVLIEKYLQRPRHIEVQVFGDTQGNIIHLFERDCSAQRRHQKVVEEAPAPGVTPESRAAMGKSACDAARAVGYVGAGTVEFIADQDGTFYFMEMNTRLQVEHPVTEMITGLDLVEWQLRVANGERLPLLQEGIPLRGHSIEVRVYAEEPEKNFLPSIGRLAHFVRPTESPNVRVDTGVSQGDIVGPHYDPMLAKLIVWDETRAQAIERMLLALDHFEIAGVGNNIAFLQRLVSHPDFRSAQVDTGLIARETDALVQFAVDVPNEVLTVATLWTQRNEMLTGQSRATASLDPFSPWATADAWRLNAEHTRTIEYAIGENTHIQSLRYGAGGLVIDGSVCAFDGARQFLVGTQCITANIFRLGDDLHIFSAGQHHVVKSVNRLAQETSVHDGEGGLSAPMPGKIVALMAAVGDLVEKGAPLVVMEAMKMEHTLLAPAKGRINSYLYAVGEQVKDGAALVDFQRQP